jgi:RimJ/RimL family protein N-acetyltransferase
VTGLHVTLSELEEGDLPFLLELWHTPEVMRYADEFPRMRGWNKEDGADTAWQQYAEHRARLGPGYVQLILRLDVGKGADTSDGTPLGESFFAPLPEGYTFGKWAKPEGIACVMGDIKLLPGYWGRGLGTQGMQQVVRWLFTRTGCQLCVVPPHRLNPAAQRVYEKAGFVLFTGMRSWRNHQIMELSRDRFEALYRVQLS